MQSKTLNHQETHLEDWLILGTPVYKHKSHLLYCFKEFKKILCEKPVGMSLNEINCIQHAAKENNITFRVNYALRFLPIFDEIKEFIKSNNVESVIITCNSNFNQNVPNKKWKENYKTGGGVLYSIFPHLVDILNFLGFNLDLSSISFESTSKVPMDDIKLTSKSFSGCSAEINIDLKAHLTN